MKSTIQLYNNLKQKVSFLYIKLNLNTLEKTKGRKLLIPIIDIISLAIFRARQNISSKKSLAEIFNLQKHYKTMVVNLNRFAMVAGIILSALININRKDTHVIKHTDSTDIPVCLNKNAKRHKTMKMLSAWGKTGKGWFYGLKLHITTDLKKKLLALKIGPGNQADRSVFLKLNENLLGLFIADAGYLGEKLSRDFYIEHKRILLTKVRANMKKLATPAHLLLYETRMLIEWNFRVLKMTYGLVTSLPRSVNGYLAHYIYSLTAFVLG